jgi:hypothetical protein
LRARSANDVPTILSRPPWSERQADAPGCAETMDDTFHDDEADGGAPKGRDPITQDGAPIRRELVALGCTSHNILKPQWGETPVSRNYSVPLESRPYRARAVVELIPRAPLRFALGYRISPHSGLP